jgi:DNA-binding NarL/FixJ family response regulator
VLKNASAEHLHQAVVDVARGLGVLDQSVVRRVLDEFSQRTSPADGAFAADTPRPTVSLGPLTEREADVAAGVLRGLTNSEIGLELHLAPSTIKWHLERIRMKTGARTRVAIADWARRHGLSQ